MKYINEIVISYAYSHKDGTKIRQNKEIISRNNEFTEHKIETSMFRLRN